MHKVAAFIKQSMRNVTMDDDSHEGEAITTGRKVCDGCSCVHCCHIFRLTISQECLGLIH